MNSEYLTVKIAPVAKRRYWDGLVLLPRLNPWFLLKFKTSSLLRIQSQKKSLKNSCLQNKKSWTCKLLESRKVPSNRLLIKDCSLFLNLSLCSKKLLRHFYLLYNTWRITDVHLHRPWIWVKHLSLCSITKGELSKTVFETGRKSLALRDQGGLFWAIPCTP